MKWRIQRAALIATLACAAAAPENASTVQVSGVQSPSDTQAGARGDPCRKVDPATGAAPFLTNTMTGSLIGCWYTDTFKQTNSKPDGTIHAIGKEHFLGCVDVERKRPDVDSKEHCARNDPHGTLAFTYIFDGTFDRSGKEVRGGCRHLIVSGTGGFDGARGRLEFTDNVTNRTSAYRGQITLGKPGRPAGHTASAAISAQPLC